MHLECLFHWFFLPTKSLIWLYTMLKDNHQEFIMKQNFYGTQNTKEHKVRIENTLKVKSSETTNRKHGTLVQGTSGALLEFHLWFNQVFPGTAKPLAIYQIKVRKIKIKTRFMYCEIISQFIYIYIFSCINSSSFK